MIKLKEIPLGPMPEGRVQRPSSEDDRIRLAKSYLVKIYGSWYAGTFSKQWYGWSFSNWGNAGCQLNSISGPLFEIIEEE